MKWLLREMHCCIRTAIKISVFLMHLATSLLYSLFLTVTLIIFWHSTHDGEHD